MATETPAVLQQMVSAINAKIHSEFLILGNAECAPTGSRVICTPPVMETDDDWLVFVPEELAQMSNDFLQNAGATNSAEQEHYPDGVVWWLGTLNIIVLFDHDIYYRWVAATYYAKQMNLLTKEARKEFFGAMIDMRVPLSELVL